jgi:hypothetical protein
MQCVSQTADINNIALFPFDREWFRDIAQAVFPV